MPQQQALPTWLALNNMNSTSESGMTDPVTGFPYEAGGLGVGDYFDLTTSEAFNASFTTNGICYSGRYRYVQVDSGATAAFVKTGTIGFMRAGSNVASAVTVNAGTGLTNGSYQVSAVPGSGGGTGAVIGINVSGGSIVANPSVVNGGFGYTSTPSFSLAALGGSGAAVQAQLNITPNIVTSIDVAVNGISNPALAGVGPVRPVVFLNAITPGNYGFIQEQGIATVLAGATKLQTLGQTAIVDSSALNGTMTTSSASATVYTVGNVIDPLTTSPLANTPFKILFDGPVIQD